MITVRICVGSACHLKGSYEVINSLQSLIDSHNMCDKVVIKGSFCLGHCSQGVSVKTDDGEIHSVTTDTVTNFFNKYILGRLSNENNELLSSKL